MFATHSNNSAAWNRSYCGDDGFGCCSAAWSSSCDGGGGDSGCWCRRRGGGPSRMTFAGLMRRLPPAFRCVGWSRTNWMYPPGEWWRGDCGKRELISLKHEVILLPYLTSLKDYICASVCAHLARSVRLLMLLDRSSSLSYRRGLSKK